MESQDISQKGALEGASATGTSLCTPRHSYPGRCGVIKGTCIPFNAPEDIVGGNLGQSERTAPGQ